MALDRGNASRTEVAYIQYFLDKLMRTEIQLLCLSRQEKKPGELSKFKLVMMSGDQKWGAKRSEIWCNKAKNERPTTT